jgi:hypothetical protein
MQRDTDKIELLKFPLIVGFGELIIPTYSTKVFIRTSIKRWIIGNRYLMKNGSTLKCQIDFLVDREGKYRRVITTGYRRECLRPLAWLVDFVLREVEIEPGQSITVGELLKIVTPYKSPAGFPTAGHLKGFLRKKPSGALFESEMFREFWSLHCARLPEETWSQEYPYYTYQK